VHIGQPKIAATKLIRQLLVVESEPVQWGGWASVATGPGDNQMRPAPAILARERKDGARDIHEPVYYSEGKGSVIPQFLNARIRQG
jgi:hypothetical protein